MFHLKTEPKTIPNQEKKPEEAPVKTRMSLEGRGWEHGIQQPPRPDNTTQSDVNKHAKNTGGIIYWARISAIDCYSRYAENKGGYSFYEDFST